MTRDLPSVLMNPPRPDLSSFLTGQILALIRQQGLQPGDRLPTAKALAERFSVATPTIREALRRLQATGVVDIRHGSGIYVRRGQDRMMLTNPLHGGLDRQTMLDLLDSRLLIEPHMAELAATRITDEELAELERILHDAEHYLVGNDEKLRDINMSFHGAIARLCGNRVLGQIIDSLIELYSAEQLALTAIYNARFPDHQDHLTILAALRAHDPALARQRMHDHLAGVRQVAAQRMPE